VLHVDENSFYGGPDAAFSLQEAEEWVKSVQSGEFMECDTEYFFSLLHIRLCDAAFKIIPSDNCGQIHHPRRYFPTSRSLLLLNQNKLPGVVNRQN
jgi:RAB protein geranylgeranyltransferase component A